MSTLTVWEMLSVFGFASVVVMVAVALGGYMVFRTKRESWDPFFKVGDPKGEAFTVDDGMHGQPSHAVPPIIDDEPQSSALPELVRRMNERMKAQVAEKEAGDA